MNRHKRVQIVIGLVIVTGVCWIKSGYGGEDLANQKPAVSQKSPVVLSPAHLAALAKQRRCVVNTDTMCTQPVFNAEGVGPDEFAGYHLSFFRKYPGQNAVDSIFWCFYEGDIAYWPSKVLPKPFHYPKHYGYPPYLDEGVDILKIFVDQTHQLGLEAFYSLRMNGADPPCNCLPTSQKKRTFYRENFLTLKRQHPDWLIRVWTVDSQQAHLDHPEDCVYLWNYAKQGVRDYKLSIIRELAENYDFEGIELDFARMAPHLPLDHQWEYRQAMTDFIRSVRDTLLEIETKRNKPVLLVVRVPDSILGARMDGLDLEIWAKEKLVDMFVPGPRSFEIDFAGFNRITADTPIKIYPCLDGYHSTDGYRFPTIEILHGVAANWYDQGADGIEFFNVFTNTQEYNEKLQKLSGGKLHPVMSKVQIQQQLFFDLKDPQSMKFMDKTFVVQRRGGGYPEPWRFPDPEDWYTPKYSYFNTNMFSQLPAGIPQNGKTDLQVTCYVADDVNRYVDHVKTIQLRLLLSDLTNANAPAETLMEKALIRHERSRHEALYNIPPAKGIEQYIEARINGVLLGKGSVRNGWFVFDVNPIQLAHGDNIISIRANQQGKHAEYQVEKVEVHIRYH